MSERRVEMRLREAAAEWTPSGDLRRRVLDAASPLVRPATTWSDRMWFSRRWRLAAVAAPVALLVLDFTLGGASPFPAGPRQGARETAQAVDEAARQAGLGAEQARMFAQRAFALASQPDPEALRVPVGASR